MSGPAKEKPTPAGSAREATATDLLIGELIRNRRIDMGLTQDELAQRINVTARQLQKYEAGTNRISASRLVSCALALDVPTIWFFERLPQITNGKIDAPSEVAGEQRLVEHYRQLPRPVREKLVAIAQVLAQEQPPALRRPSKR